MEALLQYLRSIHPLSDGLMEYLAGTLRHRELHRKEYLLRAGQVSRHICFIERGLLRCFYLMNGVEVSSWFMKEGDVIVSVESFFKQTAGYESIQAIEDCSLYYISFDELEAAYHKYPEFNFTGRALLEKYYVMSEQRLYSMRMQRAPERYRSLLRDHPELVLRVPSKQLASYLGITEVTLSALKGKMAY